MSPFHIVLCLTRSLLKEKAELAAENLALRQQLAVHHERLKRPRLRSRDRVFWVWLSSLWDNWRSALLIVKPDTVVRWHRQGFKLYWTWKSGRGRQSGRPKVEREIRTLTHSLFPYARPIVFALSSCRMIPRMEFSAPTAWSAIEMHLTPPVKEYQPPPILSRCPR